MILKKCLQNELTGLNSETMKAIILKGFGGVENLCISDIPLPVISDNEVLVQTRAIAINPIDVKTRKGKGLATALKDHDPIILGWDVSGTVVRKGAEVKAFTEGNEVFGMVNFPGHGKTYAEYVAVPAGHLAHKPDNISHAEAAAAALAALTAWQVLKYRSGIRKGDKVLIHAAAGGVGHYAVQMAKHLGAVVTGTSSGINRDLVLSLGADNHIDYEQERFEDILKNIDFVLDAIGDEYTTRSFKVLRPGGTIICIPSGTSDDIAEQAIKWGVNGSHFRVQSDGGDMGEIAGMLHKGVVRSFVSKSYRFEEIASAHQQIETGRTTGKIVIEL